MKVTPIPKCKTEFKDIIDEDIEEAINKLIRGKGKTEKSYVISYYDSRLHKEESVKIALGIYKTDQTPEYKSDLIRV